MKFDNISMTFGTQVIYDNASCYISKEDKVGIVGVNGAGKSTLLKLILNKYNLDSGKIIIPKNYNIGYLPQVITDEIPSKDITVFDYLLEGRPITKLQNELTKLYEQIAIEKDNNKLKILMKKIDKTNEELDYYEQYSADSILLKIINGMNISEELLDLKLTNLSGGQKSKIAFAKLLYSKPHILLLDEPTNHLDKDTKQYIISYLKNYKGMILVISHDISFLNNITNKTLYVDNINHNLELFNGNYDKYLLIKEEKNKAKERLIIKQKEEEEKLKKIIAKYIHGTEKQANIAKDRIKKLNKLNQIKIEEEKKNKVTNFKIKINYPSSIEPIEVKNLTFGYNNNLLYNNLSFTLTRGERVLVIGENGIGKTTLLKLIMNILKPLSGTIIINDKTNISYYAQEHEILNQDETILTNFKTFGLPDYEIRKLLGNFLFTGNDIYKKVNILSPGERSRVALAKIALTGANTLLLDEPTNHLDPITQKIIANTFIDYPGTMLVVSHNLEFVDNLNIDRILLLPSGKLIYYNKDIVNYYESINEK